MVRRGADNRQSEGHVHAVFEVQRFQGHKRLVVIHAKRSIVARASRGMEHGVGWVGSSDAPSFRPKIVDRGDDDLDLFAPQHPTFTGVGIKAADREPRLNDPEIALKPAQNRSRSSFNQLG